MSVKPLEVSAGSPVQYYSTSHGGWIDCVVDETNPKGEVQISVKKGYWMSPAEQSQRLRLPPGAALEGAGAAAEPAAGAGGAWAAEQAVALGLHGAEGLDWAVTLNRNEVSSVNKAVEKLSRGDIECPGDFCIAFSASSKSNYLLHRRGCKEQALIKLVACYRDATASRAALRTELSAARAEARNAVSFEAEAEAADKRSRSAEAKLAASCLEESRMQRLCDERTRSLHEAEERLRSATASRSAVEALEADAVRDLEARLAGSEQDASALRVALSEAAKASRPPPAEWTPRGTHKLTPAEMATAIKLQSEADAPDTSKHLEELLAASEKEASLQGLLAEEQEKRRASELQLIAEREGLEGLRGQLAALAEERQQIEARLEGAERSESQLREELAAGARQLTACEARLQGAEAGRDAALAELRAEGPRGGATPGEDFHPPARVAEEPKEAGSVGSVDAAEEPKEASSVGSAGSLPGTPPLGASR